MDNARDSVARGKKNRKFESSVKQNTLWFQSKALWKQLDLYDDSSKISKEAYFEESNGRKAAEEQLEKVIRKSSFE